MLTTTQLFRSTADERSFASWLKTQTPDIRNQVQDFLDTLSDTLIENEDLDPDVHEKLAELQTAYEELEEECGGYNSDLEEANAALYADLAKAEALEIELQTQLDFITKENTYLKSTAYVKNTGLQLDALASEVTQLKAQLESQKPEHELTENGVLNMTINGLREELGKKNEYLAQAHIDLDEAKNKLRAAGISVNAPYTPAQADTIVDAARTLDLQSQVIRFRDTADKQDEDLRDIKDALNEVQVKLALERTASNAKDGVIHMLQGGTQGTPLDTVVANMYAEIDTLKKELLNKQAQMSVLASQVTALDTAGKTERLEAYEARLEKYRVGVAKFFEVTLTNMGLAQVGLGGMFTEFKRIDHELFPKTYTATPDVITGMYVGLKQTQTNFDSELREHVRVHGTPVHPDKLKAEPVAGMYADTPVTQQSSDDVDRHIADTVKELDALTMSYKAYHLDTYGPSDRLPEHREAEFEAAMKHVENAPVEEASNEPPVKQKRHRRTKAEMEAARAVARIKPGDVVVTVSGDTTINGEIAHSDEPPLFTGSFGPVTPSSDFLGQHNQFAQDVIQVIDGDVPLTLTPQPEGGYTVTSPTMPELITEGDYIPDALENAKDALVAATELKSEMDEAFHTTYFAPEYLETPASSVTEDTIIFDIMDASLPKAEVGELAQRFEVGVDLAAPEYDKTVPTQVNTNTGEVMPTETIPDYEDLVKQEQKEAALGLSTIGSSTLFMDAKLVAVNPDEQGKAKVVITDPDIQKVILSGGITHVSIGQTIQLTPEPDEIAPFELEGEDWVYDDGGIKVHINKANTETGELEDLTAMVNNADHKFVVPPLPNEEDVKEASRLADQLLDNCIVTGMVVETATPANDLPAQEVIDSILGSWKSQKPEAKEDLPVIVVAPTPSVEPANKPHLSFVEPSELLDTTTDASSTFSTTGFLDSKGVEIREHDRVANDDAAGVVAWDDDGLQWVVQITKDKATPLYKFNMGTPCTVINDKFISLK